MINALIDFFRHLFGGKKAIDNTPISSGALAYLNEQVDFYRSLNDEDKQLFVQRVGLFVNTTEICGRGIEVTDNDRVLVAASAIIPVWSFADWHYFNLQTVILLPGAFNEDYEHGKQDSLITGMVGTGFMKGKMLLSQPALHYGFANEKDKKNVGIHEFAHLIDMADGDCDGFPERMSKYAYFQPWIKFVEKKISDIHQKNSNINPYGGTNEQEFFAVTTEYFFERPQLLKKKHPQLYDELMAFYQQDMASINNDVKPRKQQPCPCGSGKKYKRCCLPKS
ncbi:MAG: zinc-dependent peptidase [Algicola sp.]|nr:zinc-dependent peptidase [Algicola sp.]